MICKKWIQRKLYRCEKNPKKHYQKYINDLIKTTFRNIQLYFIYCIFSQRNKISSSRNMNIAHMTEKRFSPMKYTKSQNQRASSPQKQLLNNPNYYCHYLNSHYQGGISSFKRSGKGIMLLDDEVTLIGEWAHDTYCGCILALQQDLLVSIRFQKGKGKSVCYRVQSYILCINFNLNNDKDGTGCFIDFKNKKIFKLTYFRNKLTKKMRILDSKVEDNVFRKFILKDFLHPQHVKALNFQIETPHGMKIMKHEKEIVIGYCEKGDTGRGGISLNGLAVRILVDDKLPGDFHMKILQRGIYENSKLNGFGQKHFQNRNFYIGGFKDHEFHGVGIMVQPFDKKWTAGVYHNGKLVQLNTASTQSSYKWLQMSKNIHQIQKPFIQSRIHIPFCSVEQILKQIISQDPQQIQNRQQVKESVKKLDNLKIIQEDFMNNQCNVKTQSAIKEMLEKKDHFDRNLSMESIVIHQKPSFAPQQPSLQQRIKASSAEKKVYLKKNLNEQKISSPQQYSSGEIFQKTMRKSAYSPKKTFNRTSQFKESTARRTLNDSRGIQILQRAHELSKSRSPERKHRQKLYKYLYEEDDKKIQELINKNRLKYSSSYRK